MATHVCTEANIQCAGAGIVNAGRLRGDSTGIILLLFSNVIFM